MIPACNLNIHLKKTLKVHTKFHIEFRGHITVNQFEVCYTQMIKFGSNYNSCDLLLFFF